MRVRNWTPVLVGLGVPAAGLLLVLPLIAHSTTRVLGMPVLFAWVFLLCPLTTVCLWLAWKMDEPYYPATDDDRVVDGGQGPAVEPEAQA